MTHVLVVRLDSLGDVLLTGPAVRAVAAGADRVTFLAGPRGRAAAELLPGVDEVLSFRAPWIDPEPSAVDTRLTLGLVASVAAARIDQAIILTSFHQNPLPLALLLRMAGVPTVAAVSEDYPGSLLNVRHRVDDDVHEVERNLSLVGTLGYRLPPGDDGRLAVRRRPTTDLATATGSGTGGTFDGAYVVVHPGTSVPARAWPSERHRSLVAALVDGGWPVVVTGSPAEQALTASVAAGPSGAVDLGGVTDLAGLAEILAGARAVVVGNTGPAHLAAAVGAPVVSLFAPTVPAVRWRPWGVPHALLGDHGVPCAGCRAKVCPVAGQPCLASITVADVLAAVGALAGPAPVPVARVAVAG